jgi:hypothetical protein
MKEWGKEGFPMSRKADAIAELQRLLRQRRAEIDPAVLARARAAADGSVPYDRKSAEKAVETFLSNHPDEGFRARLIAFIGRNSH